MSFLKRILNVNVLLINYGVINLVSSLMSTVQYVHTACIYFWLHMM